MKASPLANAFRGVLDGFFPPVSGSDGEMLERFVSRHDEAAFAGLVHRHGPMVLRLCRRMLSEPADAEDAFQATFSVLARRAGTIIKRPSLGSWLYGVARTIALQSRRSAKRRRAHELSLEDAAEPSREPAASPESDIRPILDEELGRLPERYRAPLVLCYLESRSVDEAAAELGVARGTVASRMSRGRDLLRKRLARRGLALSAAALTAQLESAATAAIPVATLQALIPAGFVAGTVIREGAAILAKETLQGIVWGKVARWGAIVVACMLILGAGAATSKWAPSTAKPRANANASADQGDDFYVRWRFDDGPPKDIRVIMGQWTHRPGKPGVMVVPEAALLLPTRLPKRPVVVSVKMPDFVRRSGTGDFSVKWMRGDLGNLANDWWWDKVTTKPGNRYSWYAVDRWTVLVANEKIICVHDYQRPYPGDGLLLYVSNQVIEEIELRGLRWQDLPPEVRNVERAVKTLKNGPRHEDAQGRVWDERGKLVPPVRQARTFKFFP